jgi:hypothetical protein
MPKSTRESAPYSLRRPDDRSGSSTSPDREGHTALGRQLVALPPKRDGGKEREGSSAGVRELGALAGDDAAAGVVVIQQVDFGAEAAHAVPSGPRGRERLKSQGRMPAVTTGSRADVVVRARSSTIAFNATVRQRPAGGVAPTRRDDQNRLPPASRRPRRFCGHAYSRMRLASTDLVIYTWGVQSGVLW